MRQIIFPVDFSSSCDAMAPLVAALTRAFGADLILLHVMESEPFWNDFDAMENQFGLIRDTARARLQNYQSGRFDGLPVDRVFKIGHPAEEIVLLADRLQAELIVMPTRGRTRFRQLLLGSVTASVLHDTGSAVFTSAHADDDAPAPALPRSILCAIDMNDVSSDVLAIGGHFAETLGASLHAIHVAPPLAAPFTDPSQYEPEEVQEHRLRERFAELARDAEVTAPFEILRGHDVTAAVIEAEARFNADLLVIGRGKMHGVLGRLRTGAHELIRRSRCPVLSY